jgi:hypothetical protein
VLVETNCTNVSSARGTGQGFSAIDSIAISTGIKLVAIYSPSARILETLLSQVLHYGVDKRYERMMLITQLGGHTITLPSDSDVALSANEQVVYESLFKVADVNRDGILKPQICVAFFGKSLLPSSVLAQVGVYSQNHSRTKMLFRFGSYWKWRESRK